MKQQEARKTGPPPPAKSANELKQSAQQAMTTNQHKADGTKVKTKTDEVREYLSSLKPELKNALAKTVKPEYIISVTFSAIRANPDLLQCSPVSLANCVLQSAQIGLSLDPTLGEAYMVPFNNSKTQRKEATFMVGYKGFVKLGYQSQDVKDITAYIVYENDFFAYEHGSNETLRHIPATGDRGKMVGAYAQTHLVRGGYIFEYMSKEEIDDIRSKSKAKDGSAWREHYEAQARKTPLRHIFKFMPNATAAVTRAVDLDERATFGVDQGLDIGEDGTVGSTTGWEELEDAKIVPEPEKTAPKKTAEQTDAFAKSKEEESKPVHPLLPKEDREKFIKEKVAELAKITTQLDLQKFYGSISEAERDHLIGHDDAQIIDQHIKARATQIK